MGDFVQLSSVVQAGWNAFLFSWKFLALRVFLERKWLLPGHLCGRCACDCGRGPVSGGAFFLLFSSLLLSPRIVP